MGSFLFLTFFTQPGFSVCLCLRSTLYGCCAHVFKQKEGKTKHQKAAYSCFFYSYWCDSSSSGVVVLILLCSKADRRHILRKKRRTTKISECYIYVCLSNVCIRLKYAAAGMWYTPNDKHWICFFLFLAMAGCLGLMLEFVVVVWMYEVVKFTFWVHFLLYRFFCSILTPADSF